MEVIGKGAYAEYTIGPLNWNGTAKLGVAEDREYKIRSATFEYLTDEQMQELFLAYIALREAVDAD